MADNKNETQVTAQIDDTNKREIALNLAVSLHKIKGGEPSDIVATAQTFYGFINGVS